MSNKQIRIEIEKLVTEEYNIKIRRKADVWWQRWLAKLLFFNPRYLEDYSNATATEIHLVDGASWRTIAHELQHIVDMRKMLFVGFVIIYYSPQIFGLLAIANPWWLLAVLPLPAVGRLWLEARAYGVSLAVRQWQGGFTKSDFLKKIDYYTNLMVGPSYYWTMPLRSVSYWMIFKNYKWVMWRETKLHKELYEIITSN